MLIAFPSESKRIYEATDLVLSTYDNLIYQKIYHNETQIIDQYVETKQNESIEMMHDIDKIFVIDVFITNRFCSTFFFQNTMGRHKPRLWWEDRR